jgi:WD40 repeat protein
VRPDRLFVGVLLLLVSVPAAPAQELTERGTFKGHKFRVRLAELSPDGKILAAGGGDTRGGELKLWDAVTGKEIASLPGYTNSPYLLAFSADGKRLASGGQGPVQVWDVNARKEIASFKDFHHVDVVALNRDGTRLAAGAGWLAKLWEVAPGKELSSFRHHVPFSGVVGAAFSRDLATLAARNYQEIDLWDAATGKEKATLSEHRGEVGCMVWSADDKTLIASSTRYEGKDFKWKGDVKLWDVTSGKERATLPGPFGRILAMAPSPDGKTLALLDSPELHAEQDLKLVDVDTGRQRVLRVSPGYSFLSLGFTPEGKLLVTGASVDTLRLWEVSLPKRDVKP